MINGKSTSFEERDALDGRSSFVTSEPRTESSAIMAPPEGRTSLDLRPKGAVPGDKPVLLMVDDDEEIRAQLRWALVSSYTVLQASDRSTAIKLFQAHRPGVVLLDLGLPPHPGTPEEGLAALTQILDLECRTKVVIVSGQSERAVALRAVGAGAYDFLCKPVGLDELKARLARCFHVASLERDYRDLQRRLSVDGFAGMVGNSPPMQALFASIRKVATTEAPVLILGESGTGKEIAARAIHQHGTRRAGPFVAINCSAIPESLLESELFGHEKGAFTGAQSQRKGRIEQADGGTLFLDEIGEVPLPVQVKLLRFLQEQTIERVGGKGEIRVDTRVLAATHVDLEKGMREGTFREDFFYRLAVVRLVLAPLRARDGDLRLIAQSFLHRFSAENGRSGLTFGQDALRAILRHPWPGNVRELQNRVRRAVIMGEGPRLSAEDLELEAGGEGTVLTLKEAREDLERNLIRDALKRHGGRIAMAASELGVSRPSLYDLMGKLGLDREALKG
ncbi:MAG: PEP-CTERM-box response regulator transcription factor [Opitutaceae bacterium]|nr:PEP-CTERM-box response regulator transcription factor [Opitutaceae bacterium]